MIEPVDSPPSRPRDRDHAELEAERLERLEHATRRRRWDSVLAGCPRDADPAAAPTPLATSARPEPAASDLLALIELLTDRIDRLERRASRLDVSAGRRDRRERLGRRLLTLGLSLAALAMILLPLAWKFGLIGRALAGP